MSEEVMSLKEFKKSLCKTGLKNAKKIWYKLFKDMDAKHRKIVVDTVAKTQGKFKDSYICLRLSKMILESPSLDEKYIPLVFETAIDLSEYDSSTADSHLLESASIITSFGVNTYNQVTEILKEVAEIDIHNSWDLAKDSVTILNSIGLDGYQMLANSLNKVAIKNNPDL